MQQPPSNRRVGCVMWLAIVAIIMSGLGLLVDLTQELAWDGRIEELNALYVGIYAPLEPTAEVPVKASDVLPDPTSLPASAPTSVSTSTPVPVSTLISTSTPVPTPLPVAATGITYEQICEVDESNMTDPQLEAHAQRSTNQTFSGWQGWIYDVVSNSNDTYDLQIAMEERNPFWGRDIVVENIPTDLALRLNVEQQIVFDGHIARVEYIFESMCNPMVVDNFAMR